MENQNQNTNNQPTGVGNDSLFSSEYNDASMADAGALAIEPTTLTDEPSAAVAQKKRNPIARLLTRVDVVLLALLVLGAFGLVIANSLHRKSNSVNNSSVSQQYGTVKLPLAEFVSTQSGAQLQVGSVVINGPLKLNDSVIISPSVQPNAPTAGQL
ncbi:MAG TPA: hypothetical protein VLF62_00205, partial [Candidatus Saccharimonadales bacterium]|nr:hypothetical protein [Candidatus Saccharimonadales bacterium]